MGVCACVCVFSCHCAGKCPTGDAWADEATADDTAHGHFAVCSDRGTCDHTTGECKCQDGFEGRACQRRTYCTWVCPWR